MTGMRRSAFGKLALMAAYPAAFGFVGAAAQEPRGTLPANSPAPMRPAQPAARTVNPAPAATPAVSRGAASADGVQFTISEAPKATQQITVPVNKGVLVDFNLPVREVRIANPDVAEVEATSPRQVLINGKSFGATQLVVWVENDVQRVFDVAVEMDLERLRASIRGAAPMADVQTNSVLDTIVVSGMVPDSDSAQRIIQVANIYSPKVVNHLRVAGVQQVLLRCTIAEMNTRAARQLGFNGWLGGENFRDAFLVNNLDGINPSNIGAAGSANIRGNVPFVTDQNGIPITGATTLSLGFPRVQLQAFLRALRENAMLRVLAEPNLVTVSGQEASFLVGGEFPIPVPQGGASAGAITIEYREFGVRLNFTPIVVSESLIRLNVTPEVSELDFSNSVSLQGFTVPGLTSRRVQTTVEMAAGETFAIGGLLSQQTRAISRSVPALGDVPVLGALFRSVEFQQSETELVVLVTPELAKAVSPDQVTHVPGAQYVAPNDWELFGLGKTAGEGTPKGSHLPLGPDSQWPANARKLYAPDAGPVNRMKGPVGPAGIDEGQ